MGDWRDLWREREIPPEEWPKENPNSRFKLVYAERVTACNNRPGLKMIYVQVFDEKDEPLRGIIVRFDTEPSEGIAYDHRDIWGVTDKNGYVNWDHLGRPTRYRLYMNGDEEPLVENVRTDLGHEYCYLRGIPVNWRPINRPGIYSYRIEIQRKSE